MSLTIGGRVGSYEILGRLGAGGMGEVFLAHDTNLKRRVAIKTLPQAHVADAGRRARLQREAEAVAALNHPNIAAIYDFGEADGVVFMVLELVEGDTLADRVGRGALPPREALTILEQILGALETAHARGICHRDLKPANIKLTGDGRVKVLDFGLARFVGDAGSQTTSDLTTSGVIVGTAGYMAPEQAKGLQADQRSDIFSFGCIAYELLGGRRAFDGVSATEVIANILKSDVDWSRLPGSLDRRVVTIIRRCLEKDPAERWHAAADIRLQLEDVERATIDQPPSPRRTVAIAVVATVLAAITGGYATWSLRPPASRPVTRFSFALPDGQQFSHVGRAVLALSRDGANLVYVADRRLHLRPMSGFESHVIAGSEIPEGVQSPVFSPDGQWVAFRSVGDGTLKRIPIGGGAPVTICTTEALFGLNWSEAGLLFGQFGKGILRVSPDGGAPEVVIPIPNDQTADAPQMLPDGKTVLYSLKKLTDDWDKGQVVVESLGGGGRKTVLDGGAAAVYVPTGHLVYAVAGVLFAAPFDLRSRTVSGGAVAIVEGVDRGLVGSGPGRSATAHYTFSSNGSLAFMPGSRGLSADGRLDLGLFDRKAGPQVLGLPAGAYAAPRASPDGKWAAVEREDGAEVNVWIADLAGTSVPRRLTFGGKNRAPVWSGDSQWVIFQSDRDGAAGIFRQRADGSGAAERLTTPETGAVHIPQSSSRDGAHLLFTVFKDRTYSLWDLLMKDRSASPYANVEAAVLVEGAFSPDGKWVAYQAGQAAQGTSPAIQQSYVQPFPATGAKYQVPARTGAGHPVWSAAGDTLLTSIAINRDTAIPVVATPRFTFGRPDEYPHGARLNGNPSFTRRNWDPLPDGRILGVMSAGATQSGTVDAPRIAIVLNFFDELRERVR